MRIHVFWGHSFDERADGRGWDLLVAFFQMVVCFSRITNPSFKGSHKTRLMAGNDVLLNPRINGTTLFDTVVYHMVNVHNTYI